VHSNLITRWRRVVNFIVQPLRFSKKENIHLTREHRAGLNIVVMEKFFTYARSQNVLVQPVDSLFTSRAIPPHNLTRINLMLNRVFHVAASLITGHRTHGYVGAYRRDPGPLILQKHIQRVNVNTYLLYYSDTVCWP
jgi:hypothetical protein